ncbi:hypothetical protein Ate01nite_71860 [Actinoplanes teichomyceticus]|nr:hypothetical protein Ate01nite_71860 [Actinoplanes teichomyceticus]
MDVPRTDPGTEIGRGTGARTATRRGVAAAASRSQRAGQTGAYPRCPGFLDDLRATGRRTVGPRRRDRRVRVMPGRTPRAIAWESPARRRHSGNRVGPDPGDTRHGRERLVTLVAGDGSPT